MLSENFSADSENIIADVVINTRYDKDLDINGLVIKFDNKELEVIGFLLLTPKTTVGILSA
jgi:head-tail adaptor